jgi:hypothetical protein
MRQTSRTTLMTILTLLILLGSAAPILAETHANDLPPLTLDGPYPRLTPEELAASGYPDHQHAYFWPGWQVPTHEDGRTYGFGSICQGMNWLDREDVVSERGLMIVGQLKLIYNPGYKPCVMGPFMGIAEMALMDVGGLLGLSSADTLLIDNTDLADIYRIRTGHGVWRMYKREGDVCVIQPIPILMTRTLGAHAAYDLITGWLLDENGCGDLPAWLREGLMAYVADMGVHLNNYMLQFRYSQDEILLTTKETSTLLQADPILDDELDREMYRRARYMAFMMVWQLVEEHGGMKPLRAFLAEIAAGGDADEAASRIYGHDLAGLAVALDPNVLGEPIGTSVDTRRPHVRPAPQPVETPEDTQ